MTELLPSILAIANFLFVVAGIGGGWLVLRSSLAKSKDEVQARVLQALQTENELLRSRVERVEKENNRLGTLIQTLIAMLKKSQHIEIEIDGEIITIRSPNGTHSSRIQSTPQP